MRKQTYLHLLILVSITFLTMLILPGSDHIFASQVDWLDQHVVFWDYFRDLYLQQRILYPDFAMQLGSGVNVFSLTYYGMFHPLLILSYLIPQVEMIDYLQAASMFSVILSVVLLYVWLSLHDINRRIACISCILFAFSAPLIFQAHRQIMFVMYLPYLILALIGVYVLVHKRRMLLYILASFFMILSSYYFAVTGFAVLCLAFLFELYQQDNPIWKSSSLRFLLSSFLSVALSAFVLLPTAWALIHASGKDMNMALPSDLLNMDLSFASLLYDPYGIGLSTISLIALFAVSFMLRKKRLLSIALIIIVLFPLWSWILNGGLYARPKVLIAFLPLYVYIIALFLQELPIWIEQKNTRIVLFGIIGICVLCGFYMDKDIRLWFLLELIGIALCVILKQNKGIYGFAVVSAIIVLFINNEQEEYVSKQQRVAYVKSRKEHIDIQSEYRIADLRNPLRYANHTQKLNQLKTALYSSVFHEDYNEFFYDVIKQPMPIRNRVAMVPSSNVIANIYMGNRYLISDDSYIPYGYDKKASFKQGSLYENEAVYPIGFVKHKTVSGKVYDELSTSQQLTLLLDTVILQDRSRTLPVMSITDEKANETIHDSCKNIVFTKRYDGYQVSAGNHAVCDVALSQDLSQDMMLLDMEVSSTMKDDDVSITINGMKNKRSALHAPYPNGNHRFTYLLSSNKPLNTMKIEFSKGSYHISDVHIERITSKQVIDATSNIDRMDVETIKQNSIKGTIDVSSKGYFVFTIPYDLGFTIKVDGEKQAYQKVDTAFIGFPIKDGMHEIELAYHAPLKDSGRFISSAALLFVFLISVQEMWSYYAWKGKVKI